MDEVTRWAYGLWCKRRGYNEASPNARALWNGLTETTRESYRDEIRYVVSRHIENTPIQKRAPQ